MKLKKLAKKSTIAKNVIVNEGLIAFQIRGLTYIQKKIGKKAQSTKLKTYTKATKEDIFAADFTNIKNWGRKSNNKDTYHFAWIMPPPGKGSGGHMNIFRFIQALEKAGHKCSVILDLDKTQGSTMHVKAVMEGYPETHAQDSMVWLKDLDKKTLGNYDAVFATSWETAYSSYSLDSQVERFYFIQDFEPYFYPMGSLFSLAENTYKFGFYRVTAGKWLAKKLSDDYSMSTSSYDFGSEESLYKLTNPGARKSILFYARPYTERRGFEMGILALELFHIKHPEYKILFAGWDTSNYEIPFPYENLKTLEVNELSAVYNECEAGLVLSYTNMSLLPLEIMACGAIPVVNDAPNNRMVSDNEFIAYADNYPHAIANKLSEVVSRENKSRYRQNASDSVKTSSWVSAQREFVKIISTRMAK